MADLPKPEEANVPASGLDPLHAVIREQQAALDGLESSRRELEYVVEQLLAAQRDRGNGHQTPAEETHGHLSKREFQVLKLMVEGNTSREIAAHLGISFKTTVTHRSNIMSKLDVHETASVVREAIRRGLV